MVAKVVVITGSMNKKKDCKKLLHYGECVSEVSEALSKVYKFELVLYLYSKINKLKSLKHTTTYHTQMYKNIESLK